MVRKYLISLVVMLCLFGMVACAVTMTGDKAAQAIQEFEPIDFGPAVEDSAGFETALAEIAKQFTESQSEAVASMQAVAEGYSAEIRSMQECNAENFVQLYNEIESIKQSVGNTEHLSVLTKQQESLDRLLERTEGIEQAMFAMQSAGSSGCDCNCNPEAIADAVVERLKPLLVEFKTSSGDVKSIETAVNEPFTINAGETLTHVNGIPVSPTGNVAVKGYSQPVQQFAGPGVVVRTVNLGSRVLGQVRAANGTCRRVWNAATNRWEVSCE